MRKYVIAALTSAFVLALAGVALAVQQQSATIKFNTKTPGKSTVVDSTFTVSDPDNHTPGEEGKPTRQISRVDIIFPKGTKFTPKGLPVCTQSSAPGILRLCSKKSKLADGTTAIDGRNGPLKGIINAKLHAYNAPSGLKIVVSAPGTVADNQVLSPELRGNKLITQLPPTLSLVNAYLSDFHLRIPARTGKLKGKKVAYAKTPSTCPKNHKWVTKVKYYFKDGGKPYTTPGTVNPCKAAKKHKK